MRDRDGRLRWVDRGHLRAFSLVRRSRLHAVGGDEETVGGGDGEAGGVAGPEMTGVEARASPVIVFAGARREQGRRPDDEGQREGQGPQCRDHGSSSGGGR